VIPSTAFMGVLVCLLNGIEGVNFWLNIAMVTFMGFLVGIASSMINHKRFIRPIVHINNFLEKLANGDMTNRLRDNNLGQLKSVASSLNHAIDAWSNVLQNVQKASKEINEYSGHLSQSADQTTKATDQISNTIEEMAEGAESQVIGLNQSSDVIYQMSTSLSQVAVSADNVTKSITESLDKANIGTRSIQHAGNQMQSIQTNVNELARVVKGLGERSNEIGNISEVITGIAAQTNLLALNAAIEAARAGEQGKGFAVVANEVRKLAEQSSNATLKISDIIAQIQNETNQVVETMSAVNHEVTEGIDVMEEAGDSFVQIQQSVNSVSGQIEQVSAAIQEMSAGTKMAVASMDQISSVAEQSAAATQSVLTATEEQVASMQEIGSFAGSLTKLAGKMQESIHTFKI
jgi:methyl-accepting chemotaxis protein